MALQLPRTDRPTLEGDAIQLLDAGRGELDGLELDEGEVAVLVDVHRHHRAALDGLLQSLHRHNQHPHGGPNSMSGCAL